MSRPWRSRWSVLLLLAVLALSCATEKRMPEVWSAVDTLPDLRWKDAVILPGAGRPYLSLRDLKAMEVGDSIAWAGVGVLKTGERMFVLTMPEGR